MTTIKMLAHVLRTPKVALAGLLLAVGLVTVPASPAAAADSGDGLVACNNGEICFQWIYGNNNYVKQFWYDANHYANSAHGAYYFWSVPANAQSSFRLMDNAEGLRNRDTVCTVYLWDVDGNGVWYKYNFQGKQAAGFANIVGNRNNGHSRCTNGAPINR